MYEINRKVIYVKGAKNGAIYNLNNGKIFSINSNSCNAIDKIIDNSNLNIKEIEYKKILEDNGLLTLDEFTICKYIPPLFTNKPKLVWLEITQSCNCKCVHCYEGTSHRASKNQLSLEQWLACIDQVADSCFKRVVIIGGEPCTHKDIAKIAEYSCNKGLDTTIFTNGTLISDELKDIILKNNIRLKFSIYGHTALVHDTITQNIGSFDKLINNIKYFQKKGININLAVVIMKENEKYYNEIRTFLDSLGISGYKFDVIRQVFTGTQNLHLPNDNKIMKSVMRTSARFDTISEEKFSNAYYHNTCWNGKLVISEDGNILPCVFERNISMGNIRNMSIDTIINGDRIKEFWDYTFDRVDECKDCEFRFACKDCRPLAMATGNKGSRNPRCTYDVYKGEWR